MSSCTRTIIRHTDVAKQHHNKRNVNKNYIESIVENIRDHSSSRITRRHRCSGDVTVEHMTNHKDALGYISALCFVRVHHRVWAAHCVGWLSAGTRGSGEDDVYRPVNDMSVPRQKSASKPGHRRGDAVRS